MDRKMTINRRKLLQTLPAAGLLAQRAGISRQTIRFIELEERNPTLITLLRIASVLDLKIEDIIARARRAVERSR